MINLQINIRNPWSNTFKSIAVYSGKLFENKFWEIQFMRTSDIICFNFAVTTRQDHAGITLEFGLLSFNIDLTVYDSRHWNPVSGQWENY